MNFCFENRIKVLLNLVLVVKLNEDIIEKVIYLILNEYEYKIVFDINEGIEEVLKKYLNKFVIIEGKNGVRFYDGEEIKYVFCISVDV